MKCNYLFFIAALSFIQSYSFSANAKPIEFDQGPEISSNAWSQRMKANGDTLKQHKVRQLFLVHGTFVGDDPSGLINFLGNIDPDHKVPILPELNQGLKQGQKKLIDLIARDEGNFTNEYAQKLCSSLGNDICDVKDNFEWGSGDYHFARLDGALKLTQRIAEKITEKQISKDDRVLLFGHSHAGQVFALLTTLMEDGEKGKQIKKTIMTSKKVPEDRKKRFQGDLDTIKGVFLDFVTFGTPIRYQWGKNDKWRVLPVINHRSDSTISGIPSVRDGDYVQQWGVEGTDLPSDTLADNKLLDSILDDGINPGALIGNLNEKGRRQPKYWDGSLAHENILVDYHDNYQGLFPKLLPIYSIKKVFGHGVYTTEDAMFFNTNLIIKYLYP